MIKSTVYCVLLLLFLSCSIGPDFTGPQNQTNSSYTYSITWTGPATDPAYQICSIGCDLLTSETDQFQNLGPEDIGTGSISWMPANSSELPYLFFSTSDGMTLYKKYIQVISATLQSQSINTTMIALDDYAYYTNLYGDTHHISVNWSFITTDNNVVIELLGYDQSQTAVIDTVTISTSGSGWVINSYGKYDIWICVNGHPFYLDTGLATTYPPPSLKKSIKP
jgi:hypothetical protein